MVPEREESLIVRWHDSREQYGDWRRKLRDHIFNPNRKLSELEAEWGDIPQTPFSATCFLL